MKTARTPSWQILLAFAIIYFVWGSTFLAIRVGVREVPPFLLAAMRFFAAGLILYVWMRLKGSPSPSLREWAGASFLGTLIFVVDYGCLFWAEQRVPSGIAAVILATIPVFITLSEITFRRSSCQSSRGCRIANCSGYVVDRDHSDQADSAARVQADERGGTDAYGWR